MRVFKKDPTVQLVWKVSLFEPVASSTLKITINDREILCDQAAYDTQYYDTNVTGFDLMGNENCLKIQIRG